MRLDQSLTLQRIGDGFGISRERVRRIVEMGRDFYRTESTIGESDGRFGKIPNMPNYPLTVTLRFWSLVDVRNQDECWPWIGCLDAGGRGRFRFDGKVVPSHTMVNLLTNGLIESSMMCAETPICCNPLHIFSS